MRFSCCSDSTWSFDEQFRISDHVDLTKDVRSRAGDRALAPRTYVARSSILFAKLIILTISLRVETNFGFVRLHVDRLSLFPCFRCDSVRAARNQACPKCRSIQTIIMNAKRYMPRVRPIARCICANACEPDVRVLFPQIKMDTRVSNRQMNTPAIGNRSFHLMSISGSIILEGGRINARQIFEPSHQPFPQTFCESPEKIDDAQMNL